MQLMLVFPLLLLLHLLLLPPLLLLLRHLLLKFSPLAPVALATPSAIARPLVQVAGIQLGQCRIVGVARLVACCVVGVILTKCRILFITGDDEV